jgi:hypothetical protein
VSTFFPDVHTRREGWFFPSFQLHAHVCGGIVEATQASQGQRASTVTWGASMRSHMWGEGNSRGLRGISDGVWGEAGERRRREGRGGEERRRKLRYGEVRSR